MPDNDPITTGSLAAAISTGMDTTPLLAAHARPVADRLAVLIRKRLPNITPADTGEVMIHLGAFLSDVMTALTDEGESPTSAILIATSAIAITGIELHDNGNGLCGALPTADLVSLIDGTPVTAGPCVLPADLHRDHEDGNGASWTEPRKEQQNADDAAARIRSWRNQLDADLRAWFVTYGHPIPEPLYGPNEEVPGHYGYGTDLIGPNGKEMPLLLADIDAVLAGLKTLQTERGSLADQIEARILDPADDEWDNAYNTAVRDILRFVRGDRRPGLDLVRDAFRKARGGDAPPQIQGFA